MAELHALYGGEILLAFEPKRHVYTIDGRRILSATGITSVMDKPALVNWAANCCSDYLLQELQPGVALDEIEISNLADRMKREFRRISKSAASIGSLVHAYAERYALWKMGESRAPELPVNAAAKLGIDAFLAWVEAHEIEWLYAERKVYSRVNDYCGTVDLIARIDGVLTVADHKTSSGIYDEYRAQIAGYRLAIDEEEFLTERLEQSLALRFDKQTGEFEVHRFADHEGDAASFLACLTLRRWMDANRAAWKAAQ